VSVSQKREYLDIRPETFDNLAHKARNLESGDWPMNRKSPPLAGFSLVVSGNFLERQTAWLGREQPHYVERSNKTNGVARYEERGYRQIYRQFLWLDTYNSPPQRKTVRFHLIWTSRALPSGVASPQAALTAARLGGAPSVPQVSARGYAGWTVWIAVVRMQKT
jgi:hypothetical protein